MPPDETLANWQVTQIVWQK
ncbi:DUF1131 family protein [Proteus mirabilis]